jgi:hypothetical protein
MERARIGRRELDEIDAEEAGGVLFHRLSHLLIQLFQ